MKNSLLKNNAILLTIIVLTYSIIAIGLFSVLSYYNLKEQNIYQNTSHFNETYSEINNNLEKLLTNSNYLVQNPSIINYLASDETNYSHYSKIFDDIKKSSLLVNLQGVNIGISKVNEKYIISQNGLFDITHYFKFTGVDYSSITETDLLDNPELQVVKLLAGTDQDSLLLVEKKQFANSDSDLLIFYSFPTSFLFSDNITKNMMLKLEFDGEIIYDSGHKMGTVSDKQKDNYHRSSKLLPDLEITQIFPLDIFNYLSSDQIYGYQISLVLILIFDFVIILFALRKMYTPLLSFLYAIDKEDGLKNILSFNSAWLDNFFRLNIFSKKGNNSNEFTFIESQIEKVYSQNESLQKRIEASISLAKKEMFFSLLTTSTYIDEISKKDFYELNSEKYLSGGTLAILRIESISKEDNDLTTKSLLNIHHKMLASTSYALGLSENILIPIDYKTFCIIFSDKVKSSVLEKVNKIIKTVELDLSLEMVSFVGQPIYSYKDFPIEFSNLISKIATFQITPESKSDLSLLHSSLYSDYSFEDEQQLFNAVIDNNREKAEKILFLILENSFESNVEKEINNTSKVLLLNTVKRIINYHNGSFDSFISKNKKLFTNIKSDNLTVLKCLFEDIFNQLFDTYIYSNENVTNPTALAILDYINQHYMEDISLSDLSTKFHLSESHLSRMIKEALGVTFSSYLKTLKLNEAKKLLQTGKFTVNQVSEKIGYSNVNSFIRVFKKEEGVSPGQFIKLRS